MQVRALSFQKHKRMSVVQFLSSGQDSFDYVSGPWAMKQDLIQVKEVSQAGSVNDLLVYNLSDKYVFFMDGDILTGAKQTRVLNTSVLLAPNSRITLPVSCVEQGRWDKVFSGFASSDYIAPQKLRANKAQRINENRLSEVPRASQGEVWDQVHKYAEILHCKSPTMSLTDIYNSSNADLNSFLEKFSPVADANGVAVFSDSRLLCTDVFNRREIYKEYFPKILKSSAMELVRLKEKENPLSETEAYYKTFSLFDNILSAEYAERKGVGIGREKRFENKDITGLILEYQDHLIHLTALNIEDGKEPGESDNRRHRIH